MLLNLNVSIVPDLHCLICLTWFIIVGRARLCLSGDTCHGEVADDNGAFDCA